MNYLLDRKLKQRKFFNIILLISIFLLLGFFRKPIGHALSWTGHTIAKPFWYLGNSISSSFGSYTYLLHSKQTLSDENTMLKEQLANMTLKLEDRNLLVSENNELKEILGRKGERNLVLASILSKPNRSPYDTLIVDTGEESGIFIGQKVYVESTLIGYVAEVYGASSKIILYSSPGESFDVFVGEGQIQAKATGRGGGNFEITLPRETAVPVGSEIALPGIKPVVLGYVEHIISDPRDPFQRILIRGPVNIQELKWVQIERDTK